jgi:hypothetical protein
MYTIFKDGSYQVMPVLLHFAIAASQNGFSTCELSLHKKINIIKKKMAKNIGFFLTFIFYHRAVVKKDHYMTHLLSYANTGL